MIGIMPIIMLPVTAALAARHFGACPPVTSESSTAPAFAIILRGYGDSSATARKRGLFGRSLVPDAPVLYRHLGDQTALGGDGVALTVAQREIAVAQLEYCDVGIGAGREGSDRTLVAEDFRRRRGRAGDQIVERHAEMQQFRHCRRQIPYRSLRRAGKCQVGRDRIGQKALVERLLDHRKAEMAAAMRAVEDDAVPLRLDHLLE